MSNLEQLPDEVLVHILSLLTIDEAARTCVLSHRWTCLWKFVTRVNFEAPKVLPSGPRRRYVPFVNKVLRLHECPFLDEFRVICTWSACSSSQIHAWIVNFLIPKRVKRLEICLWANCVSHYHTETKNCDCFKSLCNLSNVNGLTSLTLKRVDVSSHILMDLLSNCKHLESLSVSGSHRVLNLKVGGGSLHLKHLEVSYCIGLEGIELSAPELMTFKFIGRPIDFHIGNNPKLSKLIIGGRGRDQVISTLGRFSSIHSQLETLKLHISLVYKNNKIPQFPQLRNLKNLILDVSVKYCDNLIGFTSLIEAAPSLKRFALHLSLVSSSAIEAPESLPRTHECLKRVEVLGFTGGCPDLGLVKYLLKNAVNLEKIVIGPFYPKKECEQDEADGRRRQARDLKKLIPPRVELVVL